MTYCAERNQSAVRIGLDFDNTIVDYGDIFRDAAIDAGFLAPAFRGDRRALRAALRAQPEGERRWQEVQAQAYGSRLTQAEPFKGVDRFVARCRELGVELFVISHKSERAAAATDETNLRDAAAGWLRRRFGDAAFEGVYFEDTRAGKVARIASLRCTHAIDDLPEVFAEASFPPGVARWLFDPAPEAQPGDEERFSDWSALLERVEEERELATSVAETGRTPLFGRPCRGGANNRVFRFEVDGGTLAVKAYGVPDERGRLEREYGALEFLARTGVAGVPRPIGADRRRGYGIYEWIDGTRIAASQPGDVAEALAFVGAVDALRDDPGAGALPPAADAADSGAALWEQVDARVARLRGVAGAGPELTRLLDAIEDEAARRRPGAASVPLPRSRQTLSPSDFGFHNALRRDGKLIFLDFEYFGWDDPVKLAADFILHPGMTLSSADTKEWLDGVRAIFGRDPDFAPRLDRYYPILALKWCLIILNEFVPASWARRAASGRHVHAQVARGGQLAKAAELLERIRNGESAGDR